MSAAGWDDVTIIRKSAPSGRTLKSEEAIRQAQRAGGSIISEKKASGNTTAKGVEASKAAKIDRENEAFEIEKVSLSVSKAIQKARMDLKLTQKEFATKINEKPQIVQEYESGKTAPNQQVLGKMERILGVKLRGKDIGQPLAPKKK
ncbi:multi protein bridging factor 1-domain-containing protein [Gorgonomyces haynaldii]|nr:multi protein bridging factor 1-domain-containing protein [Gorgonomyces haynaldii]